MQPPAPETVKEQVVDDAPRKIKELKFGILSKQDVINQGVLEVSDRNLYDLSQGTRKPKAHGPLDGRLGVTVKSADCPTCKEQFDGCNGHFGHIKLALPLFHVGYFKTILTILQEICKDCSHILLSDDAQRGFLQELRRPNLDKLRRNKICKKIQLDCKKTTLCFYCGATNGIVKKVPGQPLKIIHEKYRKFNASTAKNKVQPLSMSQLQESFAYSFERASDISKAMKKAMDDLNPIRVLNLFRRISSSDCELLGMDPKEARPETLIWQYVPVPPTCIRPSVAQDMASTEDDLTTTLSDIVHISCLLREGLMRGVAISQLQEQWEFMQLQVGMYINSETPGIKQPGLHKVIRGLCQRLKGKQGRFRGNLSGKRVDFSGRTVISPDPNLAINEVAIPELVAMNLTYPEKVNRYNIEKLRERVRNGFFVHPGAVNVIRPNGKFLLKYVDCDQFAQDLQFGDIVERHLADGDIVLFNRQPSLHRLSILSHFVKVRPHRTFRLNECVCAPYNADFDGDEMNLHVPQTEEARNEAMQLMGVKHNLVTPKNGEPIISATQDFITAAYLISSKDVFYDRRHFSQMCMDMCDAAMHIDLPPPTIWKPLMLWTGKQIFNVLMRPNKQSDVLVNLDAQCKTYSASDNSKGKGGVPDDFHDTMLRVRNSEVMCGVMDKSTIGSGKKDSIFYVMLRDFGEDYAVQAMGRLAKMCARWIGEQGFSIGIEDVQPGEELIRKKASLIATAYRKTEGLIEAYESGTLEKAPGCDMKTTLENEIAKILSAVRQEAGEVCVAELNRHNPGLIMALSGSKGSTINVSQMVAAVGQQIIGGKRIHEGFQDRTLPHFPKYSKEGPAKGFVENSFFSGLNPSEFIFHAMSGREGLVDTAVKTAETGYMSRRLIKSLEDLCVQYDDTVRSSTFDIVQFQYGEDKLDPSNMEGKAKPVNFERTLIHSEATTQNNHDEPLMPWNIMDICHSRLDQERAKHTRYSLMGEEIAYALTNDADVDQLESVRDFIDSIEEFLKKKTDAQVVSRKRLGLSSGVTETSQKKLSKAAKIKHDILENAWSQVHKISRKTLDIFIETCLEKYNHAQVEPGHAVGAIGAQSIGEPGTQMTLKTFHFAGVAGMSITEGVPRIREIINASRIISTPIVTCELSVHDAKIAQKVQARIEKTCLKDILRNRIWWAHAQGATVFMALDVPAMRKLGLEVGLKDIVMAIQKEKKLKLFKNRVSLRYSAKLEQQIIAVDASDEVDEKPSKRGGKKTLDEIQQRLDMLCRTLPDVVICGLPDAQRALVVKDKDGKDNFKLMVEGYGLRACMNTEGVNGRKTWTNSIMETWEVLGIEAARKLIIREISQVMRTMDIDPRHMQLLADLMTCKGEVLGITRFGLAKMRDSVLQLASFEKTTDHLFDAASHTQSDEVLGVSENIIMGQEVGLGTGLCEVDYVLDIDPSEIGPKPTIFEDAWAEYEAANANDMEMDHE